MLKDHEIAQLVDELVELTKTSGTHESIRARISQVVVKHLEEAGREEALKNITSAPWFDEAW